MSIRLMAAAWDLPIPSTEKMVLLCLCDHANDEGICWPSIAALVRKTSKSERTVQTALGWLIANGYCTREERRGISTVYRLDPRKIRTPADFAPPRQPQADISPPQNPHPTPANLAPHPRKSRTLTIKNHQEPPPPPPPAAPAPAAAAAAENVSACGGRAEPEFGINDFISDWNGLAAELGLPKVNALTEARRRAFRARCREHPGRGVWRDVLDAVRASPFLRGEGPRGWRANFDFLLRPASFVKLIEGAYGAPQAPTAPAPHEPRPRNAAQSLAQGNELAKVYNDRCSRADLEWVPDASGELQLMPKAVKTPAAFPSPGYMP